MTTALPSTPASVHHFDQIFGLEFPQPAVQRGWLHGREMTQPWDVARIAERIGDRCWLSYYQRDAHAKNAPVPTFRAVALAGDWPDGGFLELQMKKSNALEEHPRGILTIYAESPARCETLMAQLLAHYCITDDAMVCRPRLGMLNLSYGDLAVERIPLTPEQTIPRDELEYYYGTSMPGWVSDWIHSLMSRRYGLTLLTGAPGTGKTTLLRSLAHWLGASHMCYFMPASRFAAVESGEVIKFWAEENRNSKLKKILILEDAESILLRRNDDNREKVATLLNLTDGMLGDALGLHVVCTLNSNLSDVDPALLRPGRLMAHRDFTLLTPADACRLAERLGLPRPKATRVSLAELLNPAAVEPREARNSRELGFHTRLLQT